MCRGSWGPGSRSAIELAWIGVPAARTHRTPEIPADKRRAMNWGRAPGATRHGFAAIGPLTLMPTVLSVPVDSPWKSIADAESEDNIKILKQLQQEGVKPGQ